MSIGGRPEIRGSSSTQHATTAHCIGSVRHLYREHRRRGGLGCSRILTAGHYVRRARDLTVERGRSWHASRASPPVTSTVAGKPRQAATSP
jgi:hypothetical protein